MQVVTQAVCICMCSGRGRERQNLPCTQRAREQLSFAPLFSSQTPSCVTLKVALVSITLINGAREERAHPESERHTLLLFPPPLPVFNSILEHFSTLRGRGRETFTTRELQFLHREPPGAFIF
jgi:hypothetical protein